MDFRGIRVSFRREKIRKIQRGFLGRGRTYDFLFSLSDILMLRKLGSVIVGNNERKIKAY